MKFFSEENGSLIYRENGETVRILPWGDNSLRVSSTFIGELTDESFGLLPDQAVTSTKLNIKILNDNEAEITNGKIKAHGFVDGWGKNLQLTFFNDKGEVVLKELGSHNCLTLNARQYRPVQGGDYWFRQSFESDPDEQIFGMGQYQQEKLNLKGCNLELAHRNSQVSVPFYISSKMYGFLWNNPAVGEVHFGLNSTQWEARQTSQGDYWITVGDDFKEIEKQYSKVTGRAPMMPEYGLGFWQCKLRYYNQQQVLDIAREYHKRGIPVDVLVIDYYHWPRCGDWRFDEEYFSDPEAMVKEISDMGIKVMVSIWPQVDTRSENYEDMRQQGLLVKSNNGIDVQMLFHGNNVFMDATNPRTRKYVWEKIKKNYYNYGIKTFWLDEAEPEFTGYSYEQYRYSIGPVLKTGNVYPREYARLFYEGQKGEGQEDIVNLIRCAWVGSQRYGALVWSGDIMSTYEYLRMQICAGISMGLAGIPWWTTDIGGFHGGNIHDPAFKELLARWFEFGCFCPVMRIHGCRQPSEQIVNKAGEVREQTGAENEVWSYGPELEALMIKYIGIREKMRDYSRKLMTEAHESGEPVIRAMFYEFPEDKATYGIQDQYMYGGSLLVAPICHEKEFERVVYLPDKASWSLACGSLADTAAPAKTNNGKFKGGQTITIKAALDEIPLFVREGQDEATLLAILK